MPGFALTPEALADLHEIGRYTTAQWGRVQRNRYLVELDRAFHELAANPGLGRRREEVRPGYLSWPVREHVIFYRPGAVRVEIVRILHQRMDFLSEL